MYHKRNEHLLFLVDSKTRPASCQFRWHKFRLDLAGKVFGIQVVGYLDPQYNLMFAAVVGME
jgi:hypothetical protein